MFYQSFREHRHTLGLKPGEFDVPSYKIFETKYQQLLEDRKANKITTLQLMEQLEPKSPLGFSSINTYRAAVRKLYEYQHERPDGSIDNARWESDIMIPDVRKLLKIVQVSFESRSVHLTIDVSLVNIPPTPQNRAPRVAKRKYVEKVTEASPFSHTELVGKIEESFWLRGCHRISTRSTFISLRNRFSFLMNYASILRAESLHIAELSDLRVFPIKCRQDHDKMEIVLMQMFTGKTVKADSPSQFARATRHSDVYCCPLGALAFYLAFRFLANTEFTPGHRFPDFQSNADWFDIKLLVELGADPCNQMEDQAFRRDLGKVFKKLGIVSNHVTHWCRHTAPTHCEFKELSPEFVKQLGMSFPEIFYCIICFLI